MTAASASGIIVKKSGGGVPFGGFKERQREIAMAGELMTASEIHDFGIEVVFKYLKEPASQGRG